MQTETTIDQAPAFVPENLKRWRLPDSYTGAHWDGYYVAPIGRHRDSDLLTESNWDCQWSELSKLRADVPGEDETSPRMVRESHWAVGWVEWVAIHESNEAALRTADEIAAGLESYTVLDEKDLSRREWEDYAEGWRQYGQSDFFAMVAKEFELCDAAKDWLRNDCPEEIAREFFESCVPSGEYFTPEGSGVSIRGDSAIRNLTRQDVCRDTLAQFIRRARKATREVTA